MIKQAINNKTGARISPPMIKGLERYMKRAAAKSSERFFELPLDMLCIADMNGHFIKISKSFSELTGYSEKELVSRPFSDFIVNEDRLRTDIIYNEVKSGGKLRHFENRYLCKDGSVKWLSWNSVTVPEEGLVYAIARDITETKQSLLWFEQYNEGLKELLRQKEESLRYASYLQHAVNPYSDMLHKVFPESFIYSSPKEIVSGDFFWMDADLPPQKEYPEGAVLFATADCTGHGVPAAMLTVMCTNALNKTVKELGITEPGKILDSVCRLVAEGFSSSGADIQDGMDISLCLLDKSTGRLQWSGANTPLYYVKNGELIDITATKQAIGKCENGMPFVTHNIQLGKGDMIYLFSDGYASQFGGEKGKKFMFSNFRKLLALISKMDTTEQKQIVANTLEQWRGDLEQIDDVMVVGIRV